MPLFGSTRTTLQRVDALERNSGTIQVVTLGKIAATDALTLYWPSPAGAPFKIVTFAAVQELALVASVEIQLQVNGVDVSTGLITFASGGSPGGTALQQPDADNTVSQLDAISAVVATASPTVQEFTLSMTIRF
jgi:hypothetical protein